eukprot:gnl/TRDRNA2_/TRDRNA2_176307_c12_seq1.p1 gnl/TRDRNA2_/TRDRNA2_176307_c12~~gnl/TRDRNA2_/TRDRNA2_176307_c12_seq1.p1  ORF type:complete len:127 (-),score=17.78 gnl/TRDRNA2_/TRDRNA2_176307_c12_seq1:17-397(-)
MATLNQFDQTLFMTSARAAEQLVSTCKAQGLANTAWAFVTVNHSDKKLFMALANMAENMVGKFSEQGLANTAWALAAESRSDRKLFEALARVTRRLDIEATEAPGLASPPWSRPSSAGWVSSSSPI